MNVMTLNGRETDIEPAVVSAFKTRIKGPVFAPGDAGYEESRTLWNGMIDRKPALVVRCLGVADVIACVRFAREHDLLLCIKGGGHNIGGLAVADGAMMLDMSLMRGVWVDPGEGSPTRRRDACSATSTARRRCTGSPPSSDSCRPPGRPD